MCGSATVLIPIGAVQGDLPLWLADRLTEIAGATVGIGEAVPMPDRGYDRRRSQYLGDVMLSLLARSPRKEEGTLLGIVDVDCYAPGLNFIFGQARMGEGLAFVALPRLRQSYYGLPHDEALFRERAIKECVHELGHTWGLPHCPDPICVMHFSNSLRDTDNKGPTYCARCNRSRVG